MKKLFALFCLTAVMTSVARADDITAQERKKAIQYLKQTRAEVVDATKGLSQAQWNFKPAPDRWSIAEVAEHIAAAEDFLMDNVRTKVMSAPPRDSKDDVKAIDALVLQQIPDRSHKAKAPDALQPSNRFGSPEGSLKHFEASRAKTIQFLKTTKDLRAHATDSPLGKKLDAYEWALFVAAHSERHTKQINEVKADQNFPKT